MNLLRLFAIHTSKAIYASGVRSIYCLFCHEAILCGVGLCLLLPTVVSPTRFAQQLSTGGFPARKGKMKWAFPANFLPNSPVKLHAELLIFLHKITCCRASHLSSVQSLPTDDGRAVVEPLIVVLVSAQDRTTMIDRAAQPRIQGTKIAEKAPTAWPSVKGCATKRLEPAVIRSHHQLELQTFERRW